MSETGAALADLATHFVVHCPKCDGKAWIHPAGGNLAIIDEAFKTHAQP